MHMSTVRMKLPDLYVILEDSAQLMVVTPYGRD